MWSCWWAMMELLMDCIHYLTSSQATKTVKLTPNHPNFDEKLQYIKIKK